MHEILSDKIMESQTHIPQENMGKITLSCLLTMKMLCLLTHLYTFLTPSVASIFVANSEFCQLFKKIVKSTREIIEKMTHH